MNNRAVFEIPGMLREIVEKSRSQGVEKSRSQGLKNLKIEKF
jgi:hypothetical protein